MRKESFLVAAHGPMEILSSLTALEENLYERNQNVKITFIMACFNAGQFDSFLKEQCIQILKSYKNIEIVFTGDLENKFYSRRIDFLTYCSQIFSLLNKQKYNNIFFVRNMLPINEALLNIYKSSNRICYGDAYGAFDNGNKECFRP